MRELLLTWAILAFAVWGSAALLPGVEVRGIRGAVVVAAIFGILNYAIGWIVFGALGVATLGLGFLCAFLTRWVANAILLKVTDALTDQLTIRHFGWAVLCSMFMSAIGSFAEWALMGSRAYQV